MNVAIRGSSLVFVVHLMIILGWEEFCGRQNLGGDVLTFFLQNSDHFFNSGFFRLVVVKHAAEVLRADIGPLSVLLGKIVDLKEVLDQIFVGNLFRVVGNLCSFEMAGITLLDLLVRRRIYSATHVADNSRYNTFALVEVVLSSPEAAAREVGFLHSFCDITWSETVFTFRGRGGGRTAPSMPLSVQRLSHAKYAFSLSVV